MTILLILSAYLLGSIPTGLLLGRLKGVDVRQSGSGNIGFSNVMRVIGTDRKGKVLGLLTLLGDMGKGILAVLLGFHLGGKNGPFLAGLFVFLGHIYSVWLRGKGGKGVATGLGVAVGVQPLLGILICIPWALLYLGTRTASLASLGTFALMPVLGLLWTRFMISEAHPLPDHSVLLFAVMATLVFLRHRENINRLLSNNENKL